MKNATKIGLMIIVVVLIFWTISWVAIFKLSPDSIPKDDSEQTQLTLYQNKDIPFQFRYSPKVKIVRETVSDTTGWSHSARKKGILFVQLRLKPPLQPKTNIEGATFTVGRSRKIVSQNRCLHQSADHVAQSDSIVKNGIIYTRMLYSGVSAGKAYSIVQYRTMRQNYCYSIEEVVYTANSHSYPHDSGISPFDSADVWETLNAAWESFQFKK